jgi:hypothetical protein
LRFLEGSEGASPEPTDVLGGDPPTGVTVPASGIGFAATPSTPGDGGGTGSHLSEVLSSTSLSSSEDGFTSSGGEGGEALLLPQQVIHIVLSRHSCLLILFTFARAARSRSLCYPARLSVCGDGEIPSTYP